MTRQKQLRHYAKREIPKARHPNRVKRQKFPVSAARFREARFCAGMGVPACSDLLRVSERTIRGWESGATRIPYAAYKLMRLLRGGKVLGPQWRDFYIRGDHLVTPEGHTFHFGELAWWSLLIRQARMFRELVRVQRLAPAVEAFDVGLVPSETTHKPTVEMAQDRGPHTGQASPIQVPAGALPVAMPGRRTGTRRGGPQGHRLGAALQTAGGVL